MNGLIKSGKGSQGSIMRKPEGAIFKILIHLITLENTAYYILN